jgi:hypothetical protein
MLLLSPESTNPLRPRLRETVTKLMTPFCRLWLSSHLLQCEIWRDWLTSLEIGRTGNWRHRLAWACVIFDGCRMFYQTRRCELEPRYLASYCNCDSFRKLGYGIPLWLSTSHGFTYQSTRSSPGFELVRRFSTARDIWFGLSHWCLQFCRILIGSIWSVLCRKGWSSLGAIMLREFSYHFKSGQWRNEPIRKDNF